MSNFLPVVRNRIYFPFAFNRLDMRSLWLSERNLLRTAVLRYGVLGQALRTYSWSRMPLNGALQGLLNVAEKQEEDFKGIREKLLGRRPGPGISSGNRQSPNRKNDEKDDKPQKSKDSGKTKERKGKQQDGDEEARDNEKESNRKFFEDEKLVKIVKIPMRYILLLFLGVPILLLLLDDLSLFSMMTSQITFQEFLESSYFKHAMVERLVVSPDKTVVHVFLKDAASVPQDGQHVISDDGYEDKPVDAKRKMHAVRGIPAYYFTIGSLESFEKTLKEAQDAVQAETGALERHYIPVVYQPPKGQSFLWSILETAAMIAPIVFILYLMRPLMGGKGGGVGGLGGGGLGNIFNMTKSKAKLYNSETAVKTSFKDVAGMDEAKEEVTEFVKFLKEPHVYEALGAKIPKGAILSGPPGTGKTLLAKAIAGEAGVPFLSVSGSEFVEMFVGLGSSRVRDLFEEAKKISPCIVFIDEIDAIGKSRGKGGMGGNDERENTLNQLLVEMDGFETDSHVVVLAGTNRPDILDAALTRPGRFDRHIRIDRPDVNGRKDIYLVHLKPLKLSLDKDASASGNAAGSQMTVEEIATRLAYSTPGFAGADIANVCNESALIAARHNCPAVTVHHLEAAIERVLAGFEKKSRVLQPHERELVAYHEAGHAVAGWFLEYADPVMKVTIIPRSSGALGFARTLASDNLMMNREQILDQMCVTLGGRVSEELFYSENMITTGASNDLEKVTALAHSSVTQYGLDPVIGPISYKQEDGNVFEGGGGGGGKKYSEATAQLIDTRVREIIKHAHERTTALLRLHKEKVKNLALALLEKEAVNHEQLVEILGERPRFKRSHAYEDFVRNQGKSLSKGGTTTTVPNNVQDTPPIAG